MELKYNYEIKNGRHIWSVTDGKDGVHCWCYKPSDGFMPEWVGGIEMHSSKPLYEGQELSHSDCWLIGNCYHNGSGLLFDENISWLFKNKKPEDEYAKEYIYIEITSFFNHYFRGEK